MPNTYTKKELSLLADMLKTAHERKPNYYHKEMYASLIHNNLDLGKAYRDQEIFDKPLGFQEILKSWKSKHIHFMEETPYEDVPLYINDPVLCIHAQWRLKIGR